MDIRFESVVTSIEHGSNGVTVRTQAGEEFAGDAVIVTVSLGVLKVIYSYNVVTGFEFVCLDSIVCPM